MALVMVCPWLQCDACLKGKQDSATLTTMLLTLQCRELGLALVRCASKACMSMQLEGQQDSAAPQT
eukprot:scaffold7692_cov20-Tisochrysis_lutea.AAC.1